MLKVLVFSVAAGAFGYYAYTVFVESFGERPHQACTLEAKVCPDGSTVGRTGPACTFARCPGE